VFEGVFLISRSYSEPRERVKHTLQPLPHMLEPFLRRSSESDKPLAPSISPLPPQKGYLTMEHVYLEAAFRF
jgi:hypothetical protein